MLCWSLLCLVEGVYLREDHLGRSWEVLGDKRRAAMAGKRMAGPWCAWPYESTGDWKHIVESYQLPFKYNKPDSICWKCRAGCEGVLDYRNTRPDAPHTLPEHRRARGKKIVRRTSYVVCRASYVVVDKTRRSENTTREATKKDRAHKTKNGRKQKQNKKKRSDHDEYVAAVGDPVPYLSTLLPPGGVVVTDWQHDCCLGMAPRVCGAALIELCEEGRFGQLDGGRWRHRCDVLLRRAHARFCEWAKKEHLVHSQQLFKAPTLSVSKGFFPIRQNM